MWSFRAWRRRRFLERTRIDPVLWARVRSRLPILDGLTETELTRLQAQSLLFLKDKTVSPLPGVELGDEELLVIAAQATLPLLHLPDVDWYSGFHELVIYPDDFVSPQKYRDDAGIEHAWDDERSGEAWQQGPVIMAWPGILQSGNWDGFNLVIHELSHKLDMLEGGPNGLPPLHAGMRIDAWAGAMQPAYDALNAQLDADENAETPIDPYAAEDPAEFFAVTSEYFFCAPDLLHSAYPAVYAQLKAFYRQDPLARLTALQANDPAYRPEPAAADDGLGS
ncbi:M90 family metallopeptidase [Pseudomonas sp. Marseille-QA0892]